MGFAAAVVSCLRKFAVFEGRACRSEFWNFVVFWILVAMMCAAHLQFPQGDFTAQAMARLVKSAPPLVIPIGLLVPLTAAAVRRLHDIDISGWWLASASLPVPFVIVGAQIVCFARPGTVGENRYGPDPLVRRHRTPAMAASN